MTESEVKRLLKDQRIRIYQELKEVFAKSFSGQPFGYQIADKMEELIHRTKGEKG